MEWVIFSENLINIYLVCSKKKLNGSPIFLLRWREHCFAPQMIHCWSSSCAPRKPFLIGGIGWCFYSMLPWRKGEVSWIWKDDKRTRLQFSFFSIPAMERNFTLGLPLKQSLHKLCFLQKLCCQKPCWDQARQRQIALTDIAQHTFSYKADQRGIQKILVIDTFFHTVLYWYFFFVWFQIRLDYEQGSWHTNFGSVWEKLLMDLATIFTVYLANTEGFL